MSYDIFKQGPDVFIPYFLISLVFTIIAYGSLPMIIALTRKKAISISKYRWLCWGLNTIIFIFFAALNGNASTGAAFGTWTWAFSSLGLSTLRSRCLLAEFKPVKRSPSENSDNGELPPGVWLCNCGRKNSAYVSTCYCGLSKRDVLAQSKTVTTDSSVPDNLSEECSVCFCRKCGGKLLNNSLFCSKCGTQVVKE